MASTSSLSQYPTYMVTRLSSGPLTSSIRRSVRTKARYPPTLLKYTLYGLVLLYPLRSPNLPNLDAEAPDPNKSPLA